MKKVAICLKGAVSKKGTTHERFYNKEDLYRDGEYINYTAVRNSIVNHIVESNPNYHFDFFLHGWNLDLSKNLIDLYKPKKYLFEDNRIYNDMIGSIILKQSDFGGVSGGLSTKKSIELKEIYEHESQIKYDIVIIYRYDVLLWKNMNLDEYNTENYIYVNQWEGECNADFHFVMSHKNSNVFKYLYDSVYLYNNQHGFHLWIKNYIVNILKCNLVEDKIKAGVDQEHMRVIYNSTELTNILNKYI